MVDFVAATSRLLTRRPPAAMEVSCAGFRSAGSPVAWIMRGEFSSGDWIVWKEWTERESVYTVASRRACTMVRVRETTARQFAHAVR